MNLPPAEFFDIFGALGFIYITGFSLWALFQKKEIPRWAIWLLLLVGIIGLVVDTIIVFNSFLR